MSRLWKPSWLAFIGAFYFGLGSTLSAIPEKVGDLDEDGVATIFDVVELINLIKSNAKVSEELFPFVDINGDGILGVSDIAALSDKVLGRSSLSDLPLSIVRSASPGSGDGGVAVTRETIIRLTMPLSEASAQAISANDLYATFGGERLGGKIKVSADRKKVTLFYNNPLPPSARIRVTLKGDGLTDSRGRILDVDGDGIAGGKLEFDFETLSLTFVPGTAVCGRVFASELTVSEGGNQTVNKPLAGVTITVDGMEDTLFTVTDNFGNFRLDNLPNGAPVGRFFVHIDGRSASVGVPSGSYYPFVGKTWRSVAGVETNIGEVFLPLIMDGTLQAVSETSDTVIRASDSVIDEFPEFANVAITVPAGSLFNDDGTPGGMVGIAPVPTDRTPGGSIPEGFDASIVITVQTDGATNFDTPVPICFPNLPVPSTGRVLAPGEKTALLSFNHDIGDWEVIGPMTVSADGLTVCTDPGVGILAPGWHCTGGGTRGEDGICRGGRGGSRRRGDPTGDQECADGECKCDGVCETGTANVLLHSGEEIFTAVDLTIPGRAGMDFVMQRVYRSQFDYDGPLGFGWTFDYNDGLFFEPNGDIVRINSRSHVGMWTLNANGTYSAPEGYFSLLERRNDGAFVLTEPDGFLRFYRSDGRLFCHQDRYGNQMLFDYDDFGNLDTVIDVFGREIDFQFEEQVDGIFRLAMVEDFIGRQIKYEYDARGDLIRVTAPEVTGTPNGNDFPLGRTERYTYSSGFANPTLNHNLLSATAPNEVAVNGPPYLTWTYGTNENDPVTLDRVLTETEGGTNASGVAAGGTLSIQYEMLNENAPIGQLDLPRGKATVTHRNGNVSEYFVNERNLHIITRELTKGLRPGEPAFFETRSEYDDDGQILRRIMPEGNVVQYTYDSNGPRRSQGNVIEERKIADPTRGGGNDIVTTYTYEPLFNQVLTRTDPRGNDPSYVPPIGSQSAERYTKQLFYDYMESNTPVPLATSLGIDLSGVQRGLGDLNGDGRTDQVFGNMIRIEAPTVELRAGSNQALREGDTRQEIVSEIQWNDFGQKTAQIDPGGNV